MAGDFERVAPLEFRQGDGDGPGTISGVLVDYRDTARPPNVAMPERVAPGAFGDVAALDVLGTWQHERNRLLARTGGGGLVLTDSRTELRATLELPNTSDGRDAGELVRRGVLRGLSTGARVQEEHIEGGVRVIERAALRFVGLVDVPAYSRSVIDEIRYADFGIEWDESDLIELRHNPYSGLLRRPIRARIPYRIPGIISMQNNQQLVIEPGAFRDSLAGEIYALAGGDYGQPLASVPDGTLRLSDSADGLDIEMRGLPETAYATDFVSRLSQGLVKGVTAGWADGGSESTTEEIEGGGTRVILRKGMLCELRYRTRSAYAEGQTIRLGRRRRSRRRAAASDGSPPARSARGRRLLRRALGLRR